MKFYRWLLLMLVVSGSANAYQPKVEIIEQFDNLKMVAFINQKVINENPTWTPGETSPPLSIEGAINAVNKNFNKHGNKIVEIELRHIPNQENKWHYLIKVVNHHMKSNYNLYVVMMNGTVIPGMIQPQSYK